MHFYLVLSDLTLLAGQQKGHPASKWVLIFCWQWRANWSSVQRTSTCIMSSATTTAMAIHLEWLDTPDCHGNSWKSEDRMSGLHSHIAFPQDMINDRSLEQHWLHDRWRQSWRPYSVIIHKQQTAVDNCKWMHSTDCSMQVVTVPHYGGGASHLQILHWNIMWDIASDLRIAKRDNVR